MHATNRPELRRFRLLVVWALLAAAMVACGDERSPESDVRRAFDRTRPNLVVICIDTLRGDALEATAAGEPRMPFTASLARDGVRFDQAAAPAPWTVPSVVSLLTGLWPSEHGCNRPLEDPYLLDPVQTYAETLRDEHGYQTAAFVGGPWWSKSFNLFQGFDDGTTDFGLQGTDEVVLPWAERREAARPFFLYLHTYEAHDPYGRHNHPFPDNPANIRTKRRVDVDELDEAHEIARAFMLDHAARSALAKRYRGGLQHIVAKYFHSGYRDDPRPELAAELEREYWKGVAWVDSLIESTVASLEAAGLMENTLLVVTSDHGEAFGEHGTLMHGRVLYDELVHVPLVMVGPKPFDRGAVVSSSVGLIDVMPTFFDWAGFDQLRDARGVSMLPLLAEKREPRPVLSEELLTYLNTTEDRQDFLVSLRSERWKYVATFDALNNTHREELYDLAADPGESNNLTVNWRVPVATELNVDFCLGIAKARRHLWKWASGRVTPPEGGAGTHPVRPLSCESENR